MSAGFEINGLDAFMDDFADLENIPDDVVAEMLFAGAEVVEREQKATGSAMGVDATGTTVESIGFDRKLTKAKAGRSVYVYPKGTRKDGNKRRNAEVGFINEYGKGGQPARQFIRMANEKAAPAATDAEERVYNKYLDNKNL